jgi:hypothetical protein
MLGGRRCLARGNGQREDDGGVAVEEEEDARLVSIVVVVDNALVGCLEIRPIIVFIITVVVVVGCVK